MVDLLLDLIPVNFGISVISCLNRELSHSLENSMSLVQCSFSRLKQRNAVLSIPHCLLQTANLPSHFLRDRQTGRIIASTVDSQAAGESLHGLATVGLIDTQLPVSVECHDVVVNPHNNTLLLEIFVHP